MKAEDETRAHSGETPIPRDAVRLDDADALALMGAMRARWRRVAMIVCGGTALVFAGTFVVPRTYMAQTSVVPAAMITGQGDGALTNALTGAAAQLGLGLGDGGASASGLFAPILRSRRLGERLLRREFTDRHARRVRLLDLVVGSDKDTTRRLEEGLRVLDRQVLKVRFDAVSGVTTVMAELRDPEIAAAVANSSVEELDAINRETRSAQARQWVAFTAQLMTSAAAALGAKEEALRQFRMANRAPVASPQLQLDETRLVRDVELAQQEYVRIRTQHELARAEEAKSVPVISVLDRAEPPVKAYRPRRVFLALSAFVLLLAAALTREMAAAYLVVWRSGRDSAVAQ